MLRLRSILFAVAVLLIAPLILAMAVSAYVLWDQPPSQGERIRAPHGLVGVRSGGAYAWVLPASDDAVVLIDTGLDPEASAITDEIRGRDVLAVLLTHAHPEQVGGLGNFGEVPVYVGEGDAPLIRGEAQPGGWLAHWFSVVSTTLRGPMAVPATLHELEGGEKLEIGGLELVAISVPGHSDGGIVWAWEDVLFTGGALMASSPPQLLPAAMSNDVELAERSLEALLPYAFDHVADSHTGIVSNARADLHRLLGSKLEPPSIRLQGPTEPGASEGPQIEEVGLYTQAAQPGPDGLAPAVLVLDDGNQWVLSGSPIPDHRNLVGRRVIVRGRLLAPEASPGLPAGLVIEVDQAEIAPGHADDEVVMRVTTQSELAGAIHRWVVVEGTITRLVPLAQGARFGEGQLSLPDGTVVPVSAPLAIPLHEPVLLNAQVQRSRGSLHVSASGLAHQIPAP